MMTRQPCELLPADRPLLCVSDLHLTDHHSAAFRQLEAIAALAAEQSLTLALLGDLVEVWIGDDDDAPLAQAFRSLLTRTAKDTVVGLMLGNRDFLYGNALAQETGARLLPDPYCFAERLLLSHGDAYCTDDRAYQQLRTLLRNPAWQQDILAKPLHERRMLAASLRAQSEAANAHKAANIMDVNEAEITQALSDAGVFQLLHGHTHRPAHHAASGPSAAHQRFVLGAWEAAAWVAVVPPRAAPALYCIGLKQSVVSWWTAVKTQLAIDL